MQEAACHADALVAGGEPTIGLKNFARAAALTRRAHLRYDFKAYANPWQDVKERPEAAAIRANVDRLRPWAWHEKRRLSEAQSDGTGEPMPVPRRRRAREEEQQRQKRRPSGKLQRHERAAWAISATESPIILCRCAQHSPGPRSTTTVVPAERGNHVGPIPRATIAHASSGRSLNHSVPGHLCSL